MCWAPDMNFDPFTATLEEAQAQPDADVMPRGAVMRWGTAQSVNWHRARYEQFPTEGVACCVQGGLVVPDWLARAFLAQYYKVLNCKVATWDEAFGPAFTSGTHLSTFRLRRRYGYQIAALFTDDKFRGIKSLPRTIEGRTEAAKILGITEKQVRNLMPKTRTNVRGHKPYVPKSSGMISANDPFSLNIRKKPKK